MNQEEFNNIASRLIDLTNKFAKLVSNPENYFEYCDALDAVNFLHNKYSFSYALECEDCGLPYSSFGEDVYLSDEQWKIITDNHSSTVLCANCIVRRIRRITSRDDIGVSMNVEFPKKDNITFTGCSFGAREVNKCDSLEEAVKMAISLMDNDQVIPVKIQVNDKVIWDCSENDEEDLYKLLSV